MKPRPNVAPPAIAVRPANAADVPAMVEAWRQMMEEHEARDPYWRMAPDPAASEAFAAWTLGLLEQGGKDGEREHFHLVAELGGVVAGFIHGEIQPRPPVMAERRVGRVDEVCARRGFRGRGVGRALLAALEAELSARGIKTVVLMVDLENPDALALYRDVGFNPREYHLVKALP